MKLSLQTRAVNLLKGDFEGGGVKTSGLRSLVLAGAIAVSTLHLYQAHAAIQIEEQVTQQAPHDVLENFNAAFEKLNKSSVQFQNATASNIHNHIVATRIVLQKNLDSFSKGLDDYSGVVDADAIENLRKAISRAKESIPNIDFLGKTDQDAFTKLKMFLTLMHPVVEQTLAIQNVLEENTQEQIHKF